MMNFGLHQDYEEWLEQLAPHEPVSRYRHNRTGEDNGDAHLKRQIMGREVVVAITNGRLDFGTWEQIFYGEFDGRRRKHVLVKIIGGVVHAINYFSTHPQGAFSLKRFFEGTCTYLTIWTVFIIAVYVTNVE